jgi:hypothetical protein
MVVNKGIFVRGILITVHITDDVTFEKRSFTLSQLRCSDKYHVNILKYATTVLLAVWYDITFKCCENYVAGYNFYERVQLLPHLLDRYVSVFLQSL